MIRNTKLYYFMDKDYTPIKESLESNIDLHYMEERIAIFRHTKDSLNEYYVILSADDKVDKIIEENGGKIAGTNDSYKTRIKNDYPLGELLFGNEGLLNFNLI